MEISVRNDDYVVEETSPAVEKEDPRKIKPPRPPVPVLNCLDPVPSPTSWSSQKNSEDLSEANVLLFDKLADKLGTSERKTFLRPAEHILATFYGLVFEIQGKIWNVLNSERLPIYFVRVSVKNIKYPFRILVIDHDVHRAVDYIVNCNTKTRISEQEVCWEDQETFGVRFSSKRLATQFHDTISRMTSTLKKGEALENKSLDNLFELEVHLPNSAIKNYQVSKKGKLKNTLKLICDKEHLKANDHYLNYMQLTDDSLDMNLRVRDIRTHVIRVVSKKDVARPSSTAILEKVRQSKDKKNGGLCSFFRSRFSSRKPKNLRLYSSAPSVLQYNDNIFMVERQTEQKKSENDDVFQPANNETRQLPSSSGKTQIYDSTDGKNVSPTLVYSTKRRAPLPPVTENLKQQNGEGFSTKPVIDGDGKTKKHVKRRAPSPPDVKPESSNVKPPRPPRPPSYSSPESNPESPLDSDPTNISNKTLANVEKDRTLLPIFIPPPPPDSPPPPLEECETPVGHVHMDFDEDAISVEVPSETSDHASETTLPEEKLISDNIVREKTEHSKDEIAENGVDKGEESPNFKSEAKEDDKEKIEEKNEIKKVSKEKEEEKEKEEKDKKDRTNSTEEQMETSKKTNNLDEHLSDEELKMKESLKNLTPEQLQMLLNAQQSGTTAQNQQPPFNLQNQQYFAMHQRQQILQNLLIQQMLEQQMTQQTATSMLAMHPMAGATPSMPYVGGTVPHMQSVGAAVPHMQSVGAPMQYVGVTGATPVLVSGVVSSVQSVGAVTPTQSVGAVSPVQTVPSDVPPMQSVSIDSVQEKSKVEEKSEESNKDPPPVKDEELVNRPLFKRMLAQVSQGKLKGIPEQVATSGTSPVSQNAKIEKVPSTYVESAGKNVAVTKDEREKKPPVSLGNIGRKSSYVESAIDRNKVDTVDGFIPSPTQVKIKDEKTVPVAPSHTIIGSSNAKDSDKLDRTSEDVKIIEKISSPTQKISSPTEKKFPVTFSQSGEVSSFVNSETTQRKTEAVVPAVAEKPKFQRHLSEPRTLPKPKSKPVIGPKPATENYIGRSKTLPKTKRPEPLKISLSLSEEERLMLPIFSVVGKTSNVQQKPNVATTSNVHNNHNVSTGSSSKVSGQSKLNVVEPEEKIITPITSIKNVRERYEQTIN